MNLKSPYTYSNLVAYYFDEAVRCLEQKCYVGSIALSWSAVDYAVEFELSGGSRLFPPSLERRKTTVFNSRNVREKLKSLERLFPSLSGWERKLLFVYGGYRNTFVHAKRQNFRSERVAGTPSHSTNHIFIEAAGEKRLMQIQVEWAPDGHEHIIAGRESIELEMRIIHSAKQVAEESLATVTAFLRDLEAAVKAGVAC